MYDLIMIDTVAYINLFYDFYDVILLYWNNLYFLEHHPMMHLHC